MTHQVIAFNGKHFTDVAVNATMPQGTRALPGLSGPELLDLYNLVASNLGRGRVKRFADTKTALKRTWAILNDYGNQSDNDFEASPEELAKQKPRAEAAPLDAADKAKIADEAKARKSNPVAEALMGVAAKKKQQADLRANPPRSNNLAKDVEMPALRKAVKVLDLAPKSKVYARKAGSKQATLVDLLARPEGATFGELYDALAATGKPWKGVTIRSGLAWDINHIAGYGVKSELLNGEEFAKAGRHYEAFRLGMKLDVSQLPTETWVPTEGYDPELKLAVYRLVYPDGMTEPLAHLGNEKA